MVNMLVLCYSCLLLSISCVVFVYIFLKETRGRWVRIRCSIAWCCHVMFLLICRRNEHGEGGYYGFAACLLSAKKAGTGGGVDELKAPRGTCKCKLTVALFGMRVDVINVRRFYLVGTLRKI